MRCRLAYLDSFFCSRRGDKWVDTGFDWIADEIRSVIKEGKAVDRPDSNAKKPRIETATVPFSGDEQLAIALASIREYTVNTAQLIRVIPKEFAPELGRVGIVLISDEDENIAKLDSADSVGSFPYSVDETLGRLDTVLEKACLYRKAPLVYGSKTTKGLPRMIKALKDSIRSEERALVAIPSSGGISLQCRAGRFQWGSGKTLDSSGCAALKGLRTSTDI